MNDFLKKDPLRAKSLKFAIRIVELSKYLTKTKREFVISKQILRSGTSIGANIAEARGSVSGPDFANRFSISYRESQETQFWLTLLKETHYISEKMYESFSKDCDELSKMLFRSIRTTKKTT